MPGIITISDARRYLSSADSSFAFLYHLPLMDYRVAFGQRVRELRLARGYSQERLAVLAQLHRTYVGGVERGERNVSLINIWRLANALTVSPGSFFSSLDPQMRTRRARR